MRKLKTKISIFILFICITCLFISLGISYSVSYSSLSREFKEKSIEASKKYANEFDGWMNEQGNVLLNIKYNIVYSNLHTDFNKLQKYLDYMLSINKKDMSDVYIGYPDNKLISGAGWNPGSDYDCREKEWYKDSIDKKDIVYTTPYFDPAFKKMVVTIACPIFDNNKLKCVLAADVHFDSIVNTTAKAKTSNESYAFLFDKDNNIIVHKNDKFNPNDTGMKNLSNVDSGRYNKLSSSILGNKSGIETYKDFDGKEKFFTYSHLKSTNWTFGFSEPVKELNSKLFNLIKGFIIALCISFAVSIFLAQFLIKNLVKPIMELTKCTEFVADGDLTKKIYISSKDEIGDLSRKFNFMINNLKKIIENINLVYDVVKNSSQDLTLKTTSLGEISKEISEATQQIASQSVHLSNNIIVQENSINEFNGKIDEVILVSKNLRNNTDLKQEIIRDNMHNLKELKLIDEKLDGHFSLIYNVMDSFTENVDKISSMTEQIFNIASQTELLSLNASIEAARAGEFGKGFSVVANEVKKLSEESSNTVSFINSIISKLSMESERLKEVKIKSVDMNKQRKDINEKVLASFESIERNFRDDINGMNSLDNNMDKIGFEKDNMKDIVASISTISQETTAATEEVTASVENQVSIIQEIVMDISKLSDKIGELNSSVKRFKV
ncbi:methyl-accepting chemotaxis protein [Clostridium rectalis]|uniref:methyl-accepting chemotaxis protein n=1 Tax=Clostridium rectalis TaxID=2040295 RepID=UPI000F62F19D|nr:methyl-accepting chemotaxis protein [Clostridium rectalis]